MDFPISMLLLLCLIFLIIGAVLMLLLQYYVYLKFSDLPEQSDEQKHINAKYSLPLSIQQTARALNASMPTAAAATAINTTATEMLASSELKDAPPLLAVNFVMQFLFHELKNSNRVRKWFYRKLCIELDELLTKSTTGKLFDKLTIRELELGDQFPEIKALRVHNVELDDSEGRIENLDLLLQIHYKGNFRTSIDADMVLGKKGSLTLKVKQLSGLARLQFTRKPYTHWSLSFLGDPELDLAIESKYQGRQMQANITSLISNQIRKAVRRKHTLPNYKLRYKPFFHKTRDDDASDGDMIPNGLLTVKVAEISRLMCPTHILNIYCTLTLASLAFVEARQKDDRNVIVSLDFEIRKAKNQQIGIVFKQRADQSVEIETVLPNTPAWKSNLKSGDILLAIEGKRITSIQQTAKVIKALQSTAFTLRIERNIPGIIRNDAILEDLELYEDLGDAQLGYGGPAPVMTKSLHDLDLVTRNNSCDKGTSSESSLCNTPTSSPKKTKLIAKALKKTISRDNSDITMRDDDLRSKSKLALKVETPRPKTPTRVLTTEGVHDVEHYYQHSTVDCELSRLIHMEDLSSFTLGPASKFLNVCVYGKSLNESLLLGFVNIPISQILADCSETSLIQCLKRFELNPPAPQDLKSHVLFNQSGFNPNLCYGDILFAFIWDGNPNLANSEPISKQTTTGKSKTRPSSQDDSALSDSISIKSGDTTATISSIQSLQPRAHNFIRTHFQRTTQCDFCGKKIWLKDAAQCRDCGMSCHKKCVTKCQNSTVCGPVDCTNTLQQSGFGSNAPEFTVTEAIDYDAEDCEKLLAASSADADGDINLPKPSNLDVHRASITGLFAEGIKRVNSANNLAIPGIVSSLANSVGGGGGAGTGPNATSPGSGFKSLPPTPQHSPSRKASLVTSVQANPFEIVTLRLEAIPSDVVSLNFEQICAITEPILNVTKDEDVMTLAKNTSRNLYANVEGAEKRVEKINGLLAKLRLALDSETAMHSTLTAANNKNDTTEGSPKKNKAKIIGKSEDRIQALSVIMLYLCTGLQHAQGVACQ